MKKVLILATTTLILLFVSCTKSDDTPDPDVNLENNVNDFVWKGLNSWYNWQTEVSNLDDVKSINKNEYYTFLNGHSKPEDLFESLLHDENVDRFSWFIKDYVAQQQQFQGISKSFGFRLQAVEIGNVGNVIFYVRFVSKDSPASIAGIKRGDLINGLDGIILNTSNYEETVKKFSNETIKFSFVKKDGITAIDDKTITAVQISDNPIHLTKVFTNINGKKVGYLVYNGFRSSFNDELNTAFASLKSQGVEELVLDLRLNGGGSVATSAYLASMIYNNAGSSKFADLKFNSKHTEHNGDYSFGNRLNIYNSDGDKTGQENINRLSTINKLYVLTSSSTASASEMIINGLRPYITVKTIGTTTYGKNVGSITLYDSSASDYTNQTTADKSHKFAMQPIVFQIFNKNGESDYTKGFAPDIEVKEWEYWDDILPFGDENEVVLKAALDDIRGLIPRPSPAKSKNIKSLNLSILDHKFDKEMYIENDFLKK